MLSLFDMFLEGLIPEPHAHGETFHDLKTASYLGWDSMEQWDTCLTTLRHLRHCKEAVYSVVEIVFCKKN